MDAKEVLDLIDKGIKYDALKKSHEKLDTAVCSVSAHTDFNCKRCRKLIEQALKARPRN